MSVHHDSSTKSDRDASVGNRLILIVGVALVVAAVLGAVTPRERGDNYCGTLLYDTVWAPPCGTASRQTAIIVGLLGSIGLMMFLAVGHRSFARRSTMVGVVGLGTVAAGLATANRLLEPADEAYCGSVLNRHRSIDGALNAACSAYLRPHLVMAAAFAVVTAIGGWMLWRALRPTRPLLDDPAESDATGRVAEMDNSPTP